MADAGGRRGSSAAGATRGLGNLVVLIALLCVVAGVVGSVDWEGTTAIAFVIVGAAACLLLVVIIAWGVKLGVEAARD